MKKKIPIKIKSRKAKARKLQDWIAEQISNIFGVPYGHDDEMLIEGRPMNQKGVDVILRGNLSEYFPFSVEAEAAERWNIHDKIKQAKTNCKPKTFWIVFFKRNREEPVVLLDAKSFFLIFDKTMNHLTINERRKLLNIKSHELGDING